MTRARMHDGREGRDEDPGVPEALPRTLQHLRREVGSMSEEGDAPPELLPRVMEGVVRRAGQEHGDPRQVEIEGEVAAFQALMDEFEPGLAESEPVEAEASE